MLPLVGLILVTALIGYPIARIPASTAFDSVLLVAVHSLALLVGAEDGQLRLQISPSAETLLRTDQFDHVYFSVHDLDGRLVAGDWQLPVPSPAMLSPGEILYNAVVDGEDVRIAAALVHQPEGSAIVQVGETTVKRHRLGQQILTGVLFIEVLLLATVVIVVLLGIGKGLEPLRQLQTEIEARSLRDLRPLPQEYTPVEMQAVVSALNNLLRRLDEAMQSQQQFIANAAHQLRTPLAGLRMQVEYGLQHTDPAEWRRTLQTLGFATERTVHLANQLLTLARAEVGAGQSGALQDLDLGSIVEQIAGNSMPKAIAKDIDLGLELEPATVHGDRFLLGELLSNLVDNAIVYTPAGGSVTVRSKMRESAAVIEVEDSGPGIPREDREKVLGRFYRVTGSPGDGCGLGLAIVQEIAHAHRGSVEIASPPSGQGTLVTVRFPALGKPVVDPLTVEA
jgi:two-component system, OmpR family, sensor histidine kinase TctE